jgi:hypothetical protein
MTHGRGWPLTRRAAAHPLQGEVKIHTPKWVVLDGDLRNIGCRSEATDYLATTNPKRTAMMSRPYAKTSPAFVLTTRDRESLIASSTIHSSSWASPAVDETSSGAMYWMDPVCRTLKGPMVPSPIAMRPKSVNNACPRSARILI